MMRHTVRVLLAMHTVARCGDHSHHFNIMAIMVHKSSPPLWMGVPPAEAPASAGMTWRGRNDMGYASE